MTVYQHGNPEWFQKSRFGMFIHWGLYSMGARHEWLMHNEKLSASDYQKYFDRFEPDLFDPAAWAAAANAAGMKYFVITAKHHDGFCMWDTVYSNYKVTNTPARRDLLREIIDAFRAAGLRVGIYYSLLDWHHPDFVIDNIYGPYRELPEEERKEKNKKRDMRRYAQYMRNQVTELLTLYGKIDLIWFDFSYAWHPDTPADPEKGKGHCQWESEALLATVRSLQPDILVNDRLDLPGSGDFYTPEQRLPEPGEAQEQGKPEVWESCQTFSGSWGYFRDELTWKSAGQCIDMLINCVSRGGNLLMNVGPTARGAFDSRARERLNDYAEWLACHSRAIYGCGAAPFIAPPDCRYTYQKERGRLYLHVLNWPCQSLQLPGLAGKVEYAQFLHDGSEVLFEIPENSSNEKSAALTLKLPVQAPVKTVPVIELFLTRPQAEKEV